MFAEQVLLHAVRSKCYLNNGRQPGADDDPIHMEGRG
jgi:hypothetical protein